MSTPNAAGATVCADDAVFEAAQETLLVDPPCASKFSPLEEIESDRYLGVILDNKLSFNSHIDTICRKATNLLNLCRRNLHMCPPEIKEQAYKSIIRPNLDYASPAWAPHTLTNINKIEAVQRRAARFVLNNYKYGPDASLSQQITEKLKWTPLQHRRAAYDLSLFFKIRNGLVNIPFTSSVQASLRSPNTYIYIQASHSEAYKYSYFCRTIRLWNQLPIEVRQISSLNSFKDKVFTWMTPLSWVKSNNTWTLM